MLAVATLLGVTGVPGAGQVASVAAQARDVPTLWLAPAPSAAGASSLLAQAVAELGAGRAAAARPVFAAHVTRDLVGGHALLYRGRAELALGQPDAAAASARQLLAASPGGALRESADWLLVEALSTAGDRAGTIRALEALIAARPARHESAYLRLGRESLAGGDRNAAREAFRRLYYEFSLSPEAEEAEEALTALDPAWRTPSVDATRLELGRGQRFFGARRWADAREAFQRVRPAATGADRALISLRLAQCEFHLSRYTAARTALRAFLDSSTTHLPEAQYYYLTTLQKLGQDAQYVTLAQAFVDGNQNNPLAERVLDELATYYIVRDNDAKAAEIFRDLIRRFPNGAFGDRAAWKAGWWAYRNDQYAEAATLFETAAVTYRRADYRPSWLYWAARAREQLGEREAAAAGFRRVIEFYRNSYYGRLAMLELEQLVRPNRPAGAPVSPASRTLPPSIAPGRVPANAELIRALLAEGLYDDAMAEIRRVQRDSGTSPLLEATLAYALNRQGQLRPAITAMRRAYPQFMAEGGEALPREILTVIFPVDHWPLITTQAVDRQLDPFLMLALVAQESTFQADVRSVANAWGLMQIIPATGRRFAPVLGIRPFSTARLTEPNVNVRIGMHYFSQLLGEFGDPAPALASYNAGEHRVRRWLAERPGIDRAEFIDDIPFPETQNYVKRILGTTEDYRLLYGARADLPGAR